MAPIAITATPVAVTALQMTRSTVPVALHLTLAALVLHARFAAHARPALHTRVRTRVALDAAAELCPAAYLSAAS
jgi:hypothetical protein